MIRTIKLASTPRNLSMLAMGYVVSDVAFSYWYRLQRVKAQSFLSAKSSKSF
ncbi:hypothetical protein ACU8KH_02262 [Lachancea thermotolerans]